MARSRTLARDTNVLAFLFGTLAVFAACTGVMRTATFAQNPALGYFGVTFDLCITVPLLYYFFVVRTGRAAAISLVPVFMASLLVARALVPASHREFLRHLSFLQFPIELFVIGLVTMRLRAAAAESRAADDIVSRIETICRRAFGDNRAAAVVGTEVAALYLGLFGWRIAEPEPRGVASTTFHRRAGWGSIVVCILVLIAAESLALHLMLQRWSHTVAWVVTALDLWAALWLIGDYHAFRIRPLVITEHSIELRFGFRWSATIPRSNVTSIESLAAAHAEELRRTRSYLRLSILDEPRYLLSLREPVRVHGAAGMSREVTSIGIGPDDESVIDALTTA